MEDGADGLVVLFGSLLWLYKAYVFIAIASGLLLLAVGIRRRAIWMTTAGCLLAIMPFISFYFRVHAAEQAWQERRDVIAAMPRVPLDPAYPRRLLIEGEMPPRQIGALLSMGYFDNVDDIFGPPADSAICRKAAQAWLDRARRRTLPALDPISCRGNKPLQKPEYERGDAVIVRLNHNATLRDSNTVMAIVEIAVRRSGREALVEYREVSVAKRPVSPFSFLTEPIDTSGTLNPGKILLDALPASRSP